MARTIERQEEGMSFVMSKGCSVTDSDPISKTTGSERRRAWCRVRKMRARCGVRRCAGRKMRERIWERRVVSSAGWEGVVVKVGILPGEGVLVEVCCCVEVGGCWSRWSAGNGNGNGTVLTDHVFDGSGLC